MGDRDTIAALATATGEAGIAVIRVSGADSLRIADRIFRCKHERPSARPRGTWVYGRIYDAEELVDEGLLLIMHAPHSYTREQTIEIQGHGGCVAARRILRAVLHAGARLAEPGEFTKRAFLNGRIDLVQAEAVLDLVRARTERSAKSAIEQMTGALSGAVEKIYDEVVGVCAEIETVLDFSEDEFDPERVAQYGPRLTQTVNRMQALIETWEAGHLLREGALVVISGRPNVGKSTLMNRLLGRERAIVSPIPGTTRDTIEETWIANGIAVRLTDTAGLRETGCEIEKEGILRARRCIAQADINIYIIDSSQDEHSDDVVNIKLFDPEKSVVVINKIDLNKNAHNIHIEGYTIIRASMKTGCGIDALQNAIEAKLDRIADEFAFITVSERHRDLLVKAMNEIQSVISLLNENMDLSVIASSLRYAIECIGSITGKNFNDDIIESIFSRFCIGK